MAIDTAEKRYSILNFGDGTTVHLLFETDGAVDLDDRQHLLDVYSGISFGTAAPTNAFSLLIDRQLDFSLSIDKQLDFTGLIDQQLDFSLEQE